MKSELNRPRKNTAVKAVAIFLVAGLVLGFSWVAFTGTLISQASTAREGDFLDLKPQIGFDQGAEIEFPPIQSAPLEAIDRMPGEGPVGAPLPEIAVGDSVGQLLAFQAVPISQDRLVVFTAAISMNVTNVQIGVADLEFLASSLGGYVSQSSIRPIQRGSRVEGGVLDADTFLATVTLRIPSDRYSEATAQIIGMGELLAMSTSSSDVTDQYIDLQARITNLERVLDQYRSILLRANEISDIISVQTRIDSITERIERLTGSSRLLENQITFASVTVGLVEPLVLEDGKKEIVEKSPFLAIFNDTIVFATNILQFEIRGLLILTIGFAPVYPIIGIAYLIYRKYSMKQGQ